MKLGLSFLGLMICLGLFMFFLFVVKVNVEKVFEGIDKEYYDDTQTEVNTNVSCDIFCKNFSTIPKNCKGFNKDKVIKCLNKNNSPVQPNCTYHLDTKTCQSVV